MKTYEHRQYLVIFVGDGIKAKNIVRRYSMDNLISGYRIGRMRMKQILINHGFGVKLTRRGMNVYFMG